MDRRVVLRLTMLGHMNQEEEGLLGSSNRVLAEGSILVEFLPDKNIEL